MFDWTTFDSMLVPVLFTKVSGLQHDGIRTIVDYATTYGVEDTRHLAYILATVHHETAKTIRPIVEFGRGAGHAYGAPDPETGQTYYGRGLVQLTYKENYVKFSAILGVDLVRHPERACEMDIAVPILVIGMYCGLFTGVGLGKYFNDTTVDWFNARRIVNGLDCAPLVAKYGMAYYKILRQAKV